MATFEAKTEDSDDWEVVKGDHYDHEMAALEFAEWEYNRSDYPGEQVIDVRELANPSVIKRFRVTAELDIHFSVDAV